jgi:hypothetical protein
MSNLTSERFSFEKSEGKNFFSNIQKIDLEFELARQKNKITLKIQQRDEALKNIERIRQKLLLNKKY